MHKVKLATIALFVSFAAACGGGGIDEIVKLKDEACACKDKKCAEDVNKKLDAAIEKLKEPKDEAAAKKLFEVMAEAGACIAKAGK